MNDRDALGRAKAAHPIALKRRRHVVGRLGLDEVVLERTGHAIDGHEQHQRRICRLLNLHHVDVHVREPTRHRIVGAQPAVYRRELRIEK